jgi:hypothetical protein
MAGGPTLPFAQSGSFRTVSVHELLQRPPGRGWISRGRSRVALGAMYPLAVTSRWHRLLDWWARHRPLGWLERGFGNLDDWRPDPPVMERLIR